MSTTAFTAMLDQLQTPQLVRALIKSKEEMPSLTPLITAKLESRMKKMTPAELARLNSWIDASHLVDGGAADAAWSATSPLPHPILGIFSRVKQANQTGGVGGGGETRYDVEWYRARYSSLRTHFVNWILCALGFGAICGVSFSWLAYTWVEGLWK